MVWRATYLDLMASLIRPDWPPARLVQMHRPRWQIELAFKRLKSILHSDQRRTRDPALARSWIPAHLIAAVMLEEVVGVRPATPTPWPSSRCHLQGGDQHLLSVALKVRIPTASGTFKNYGRSDTDCETEPEGNNNCGRLTLARLGHAPRAPLVAGGPCRRGGRRRRAP